MVLRELAVALADLVLPSACAGCGRPGERLCNRCGAAAPVRTHVAATPVVAATVYASGMRAALIAYKERDRRELATPLARLLTIAVAGAADSVGEFGSAVALVPIPSAPGVARRRGGDHVLRLARQCGRALGTPVCSALTLNRAVRDAAGLAAPARTANMHGAMTAARPPLARLPGQRSVDAVIVDDIVTTGATVREAVRALGEAGWQVRGAAVVARTPLRGQPYRPGPSPPGTAYPTRLPWG